MKFRSLLSYTYRNFIDIEKRRIKYPDRETYFIIRRRKPGKAGICSLIYTSLGGFNYCEENGYLPYVDFLHDRTIYSGKSKNGWDVFFKQVVFDIVKEKNVIVGGNYKGYQCPNPRVMFDTDELNYWHNIFKKYLHFSDAMISNISQKYNSQISKQDRVLGVLCRGTDYLRMKPSRHTIQPEPTEVLSDSIKLFQKYDCNKLWLATEDADILRMFKKQFNTSLVTVNDHCVCYDTKRGI